MHYRNAPIDGRVLDVITEEEYINRRDLYINNQSVCNMTAMEVSINGNDYLLPFRGRSDDRPGIYTDGYLYFIRYPENEEDKRLYDKKNISVVDFSDVSDINEFLNKNSQVRQMENLSLSDSDEIFIPPITGNETPAMAAFKQAIIAKHMDIDRYSSRFGDNFLNDKRILKGDDITLKKLSSICNYFDIEATLILRDKNSTVANPMGTIIEAVLTDKYSGEEE